MTSISAKATLLALVAVVVACEGGSPAATATPSELKGYAGLEFGMSFNEVLAKTGSYPFNPASVKGCMVELPIRGCLLHPENNLAAFHSVAGVPYSLGLAFNRFDKLTDISLNFDRESFDDPDQRISADDCLAIHERTVDWLVAEFGEFEPHSTGEEETTPQGRAYPVSRSNGGFLSSLQRKLENGRSIFLISHYLVIGEDRNCNIEVQFREPESVERWEMSPEEQTDYERITGGQ